MRPLQEPFVWKRMWATPLAVLIRAPTRPNTDSQLTYRRGNIGSQRCNQGQSQRKHWLFGDPFWGGLYIEIVERPNMRFLDLCSLGGEFCVLQRLSFHFLPCSLVRLCVSRALFLCFIGERVSFGLVRTFPGLAPCLCALQVLARRLCFKGEEGKERTGKERR